MQFRSKKTQLVFKKKLLVYRKVLPNKIINRNVIQQFNKKTTNNVVDIPK